MTTPASANEFNRQSGVSRDFGMSEALDADYLDSEPFDAEAEDRWERQGRQEMYAMLFGEGEV